MTHSNQGPTPSPRSELDGHLNIARILIMATCVMSTLVYGLVIFFAVFQGDAGALLKALQTTPDLRNSTMPWIMIGLACASMGGAWFVGSALWERANILRGPQRWQALKTRAIVQAALLESVAIFGMVLAFVEKPVPMALVLAFFCVPLAGAILIMPSRARWDEVH